MAPSERVVKAFKTMKNLGYSERVVRPELKNLLKIYDKNWALIEDGNYAVLVDAILESEKKARREEMEQKEVQLENIPESNAPPLKRTKNGPSTSDHFSVPEQSRNNEGTSVGENQTASNRLMDEPGPLYEGEVSLEENVRRNHHACTGSQQLFDDPPKFEVPLVILPPAPHPSESSSSTARCSVHKQNAFCYIGDISKGQEKCEISLINEKDEELPPSFFYIPQNVTFQNAYFKPILARISDDACCSHCSGDCLSLEIPCACAGETGGEFAYTPGGVVKEEFIDKCISMNRTPEVQHFFYCEDCPLERLKDESKSGKCKGHLLKKFIKECWYRCGCSIKCGNRVVQRGITVKLQVFMTPGGKGWGIRTLEHLPKGAFICEYIGEVVTNTELFKRNLQNTGKRHTYPVLLDADWSSEGVLKDEEALCLDATFYGNVARFINHRCYDANLVEIPVEIEGPDRHYYHLAFFTTREIHALEELTWDYGIDFNDYTHPVKAFKCNCGSKFCRDVKVMKRGKSRMKSLADL